MSDRMTGGQIFNDPDVEQMTAGDLFASNTEKFSAPDEIPDGDTRLMERPSHGVLYEDILMDDKKWDTLLPDETRAQMRQSMTPEEFESEHKKVINSAYFADWLGADFEDTYSNHDVISKQLLDESTPLTAHERIKRRFKNGRAQVQMMDLGYKLLIGEGDPEITQKKIDHLQTLITEDGQQDMRGMLEQMVGATSEQFPTLWEGIKASPKGAGIGAVSGAVVALIAGNLGPQAGTPEEAVTVPALATKGAKWGGGISAANRIRQMEAGGMYLELLDMKDPETGEPIDPIIAKSASHAVGAINGGIELAEWAIILSTFGIGTKVFEQASAKATSKLLAEGTLKNIVLKNTMKYTGALTAEIGQEVWQESNNIVFAELAKFINNELKGTDIPHITGAELLSRYLEITEESAKGFALLLAPGSVTSGVKDFRGIRKGKKADTATKAQFQQPSTTAGTESDVDILFKTESQTETPAFKRWFGDSKVVDQDGNPQRVSHGGVGASSIEVFSPDYGGQTTGNNFHGAFHFTDSVDVADDYGRQSFIRRYQDNVEDLVTDGVVDSLPEFEDTDEQYAYVEELAEDHIERTDVYLKMDNPIVMDMEGQRVDVQEIERISQAVSEGDISQLDEYYDQMFQDYDKDDVEQFREEIEERAREDNGLEADESIEDWQFEQATDEVMQENGYERELNPIDGIIIKNMVDDIGDASNIIADQYIVFDSRQVKSEKNTGRFDPTEDNIFYKLDPSKTKSVHAEINAQTFETKTVAEFQVALKAVTGMSDKKINALTKLIEGNAAYLDMTPDEWIRKHLHGVTNNNVENIIGPNMLLKIKPENEASIRHYLKEAFGDDEAWETIRRFESKHSRLAVQGKSILHSNQKTIMSIDISTNCPFKQAGFPCVYCYVEQPRTKKKLGRKMLQSPKKVLDSYQYVPDMITGMPKELIEFHNSRGGLRMFSSGDYSVDVDRKTIGDILSAAESVGLTIKAITKQKEFVEDFGDRPNLNINISTDMEASHAEAIAQGRDGKARPALAETIASARKLISRAMSVGEAKKLVKGRANIKIRYVAFNDADAMLALANPDIDVVTMYHGDTNTDSLLEIWETQNPELAKLIGKDGMKQLSEIFMSSKPTKFTQGKFTQKYVDKTLGDKSVDADELVDNARKKMCCVTKVCGSCNVCCGFNNLGGADTLYNLLNGVPFAAVQFESDARAMLFAWKRSRVSDIGHELGHIFRRTLDPTLLKQAEDWAGVKDNMWTVEAEEKFAEAFERYLAEGKAPTKELKSVFQQFMQWLSKIYQGLTNKQALSPEIREVFDAMLQKKPEPTQEQIANEATLFDTEKSDGVLSDQEQKDVDKLEAEYKESLDEEVEPLLYIGNVTQRMKKKMAEAVGQAKEKIKPFLDGPFPTKRTGVKMTRRKALQYLEWLKADLLRRLENNEVNTEHDLAMANADYGDITALQDALGIEREKRPFSVVRAKKHTVKSIKETKKRIYEAIRPTDDAKMTVGQVLNNTLKRAAMYARKAYTAGSKQAREKARAYYAELKQKAKQRKALKKRIEKAVKIIKKKPPKSVDFFYRRAIEEIQRSIDPHMRNKRTKDKRQRMRDFLERATEQQRKDFPKKLAEMLDKKDLSDYTIEELEAVAQKIQELTHLGKTKQKATNAIIKAQHDKTVKELVSVAGGIEAADEKPAGIDFSSDGIKQAIKSSYLWALRIPRLLDWLDGRLGTFSGRWHRIFYDTINSATDEKLRAIEARHQTIISKMEELGITANDLAEVIDHSSLQEGLQLSIEQIMGIYSALKNKQSQDALVHGNKISLKTAQAVIGNLDKKFIALADAIINEYQEHYQELREVFIELTGEDLGQEDAYTPMIRLEKDAGAVHQEMIDQLLERHNLKKAYVSKNFTINRKKIAPEHQKPIDLRMVSVWQKEINRHEHFNKLSVLIKDLRSLLGDKRVKTLLEQKFGSQGKVILDNYLSRVANPNGYKANDALSKISTVLRRNVAIAYLAGNLMTMVKQAPSLLLYMADAGVGSLISSMLQLAANPHKMWNMVRDMDPQIKESFVERELQDLRNLAKHASDKTTYEKLNKIIATVGDKGMIGIKFIDGVVRTIGWNAVYQKNKDLGLSDAEAARMAQNATLRTQPASSAKDVAQLYATNEMLNWFTMFTNQLNNIFNITSYDQFAYWNNKDYQKSAMTVLALSINAVFMWVLVNKRLPEDEDDFADAGIDMAINMLPLLNSGAMVGKRGWGAVTPPPIQAVTETGRLLSAKDKEKQAIKALEANAVLFGIPVVAIRRSVKFAESGDPQELIGGKPKKKGGIKL